MLTPAPALAPASPAKRALFAIAISAPHSVMHSNICFSSASMITCELPAAFDDANACAQSLTIELGSLRRDDSAMVADEAAMVDSMDVRSRW